MTVAKALMTVGPDGNLYVSVNGFGAPPGAGQVLKIAMNSQAAGHAGGHPGASTDSGLVGCTSLSSTHNVAAEYPKIRAQFAGSRWPDLRSAGTAYVNLAVALQCAPYAYGGETVWFYERLSAACAKHGRALST